MKDENTKQPDNKSNSATVAGYASVTGLLAEIIEKRNQLPTDWGWAKVYELAVNNRLVKYWALQNYDKPESVVSYNLLLRDRQLSKEEIQKDEVLQFIENSLKYIDYLLDIVSKQTA